jgi:hypothetical protein
MANCHYIFDKTEADEQGVEVVLNMKLELYINESMATTIFYLRWLDGWATAVTIVCTVI